MVSNRKKERSVMAQSQILRAMTKDGTARVLVINSTDIVKHAQQVHQTAPTATAALGRLLTATSMLGSLMAEKAESLTIGINGDGILGKLIAVSDYYGNVRGYVENPLADPPLRPDGKLNVGGAVGQGILYVVHSLGQGEPQTGMINLQTGEIAEDIAAYYAGSEQVPTVCALGVLVDTDYTCRAAGGVLIQLLPFPAEDTIAKLEENARKLTNVSGMVDGGMSLIDMMNVVLDGIPYDPFDTIDVDYLCTCSRERMLRGIVSLGKKQVEEMLAEQLSEGKVEELTATCRFCNSEYTFDRETLISNFVETEE